jgi:hypothetical protein
MPTTHWVARWSILLVLAAIVFAGAFTGALITVVERTIDCGTRVTAHLWAPLRDTDPNNPVPLRPVSSCLDDPV